MNKTFYIVKDQKDLLSGNIIPRKVLNAVPGGAFGPMMPYGHVVVPKPITKSREFIVNASPPISPVFSRAYSPVLSRAYSPVSPFLSTGYSPVAVRKSYYPLGFGYSPFLGPPIYKLGRLAEEGKKAKIEIKSSSKTYTIEVPLKHLRSVVDYIYEKTRKPTSTPTAAPTAAPTGGPTGGPTAAAAPPAATLAADVTFTIITPYHPDFTVATTADNMVKIVKDLNDKYVGLSYIHPHGMRYPLGTLYQNLVSYYMNRRIGF